MDHHLHRRVTLKLVAGTCSSLNATYFHRKRVSFSIISLVDPGGFLRNGGVAGIILKTFVAPTNDHNFPHILKHFATSMGVLFYDVQKLCLVAAAAAVSVL